MLPHRWSMSGRSPAFVLRTLWKETSPSPRLSCPPDRPCWRTPLTSRCVPAASFLSIRKAAEGSRAEWTQPIQELASSNCDWSEGVGGRGQVNTQPAQAELYCCHWLEALAGVCLLAVLCVFGCSEPALFSSWRDSAFLLMERSSLSTPTF